MNTNDISVLVKIEDNDYISDCIKFYAYTFTKANTPLFLHYNSKFKMKDKTNKIFKKINSRTTKLNFDDTDIYINIIEKGDPVSVETVTKIHSFLEIIIYNNNFTTEKNHEVIDKFINLSSEYYIENILDKKKEENKIPISIWDDYWETIEKRLSRDIKTLYLDGKEIEIKNSIQTFLKEDTKKEYQKYGMPYKFNLLLHGLPGTGKSSLIFSLASELEMGVALLFFTKDMTDADFMRALRRIPDDTILVIEDIDTLFESRKKNDEYKNNISFSGIINSLDGIGYIEKQVIILTTNCKMVLDKALTRPGRIDLDIEFTYATKTQIEKMYNFFLPSQNKFNEFYQKIKNLKLTTAMLQKFFFGNRNYDNIIDHIDDLIEICNNNDYNTKKESMYC
jgi:ATP-dependent 26S proteasome regulatory subunit